jgi:hypothetical protein
VLSQYLAVRTDEKLNTLRIAVVSAGFRTRKLPDTSQNCYGYTALLAIFVRGTCGL